MPTLRLRIAAGLALVLLLALGTLSLALSLPTTGVRFDARDGRLFAELDGSPRPVSHFEAAGVRIDGHGGLAIEEPDVLPDWQTYDALLQQLDTLAAAARAGRLELVLTDGTRRSLELHPRRPGDLPGTFWLQLVSAALAMVLSVLVWSPRPRDVPVSLFALTGAGYMLSVLCASVYSTRELAIGAELFRLLNIGNHCGAVFFTAALTSLLWSYPLRLAGALLVPGAFLVAFASMALNAAQVLEPPQFNNHLFIVLIFLVGIAGSVVQWLRTRWRAEARAILRWFLLSIYAGTLVFTALFLLPSLLGIDVPVPQAVLLATFLPMYLGMALGVLRYRLFDLERWWFFIWAWALGGVAVLLVDLTLLTVLSTAETTSLAIAIAVVGWLYFPVRQWIWRRYVARDWDELDGWLDAALPPLLSVRQERELLPALEQTLTSVFEPLSARRVPTHSALVEIRENGQALLVPLLGSRRGVLLEHGFGGARLFTRTDLQTAQRVLALYGVVVRGLHAQAEDATLERERIRKDIHDDLGAKLLTLLHRASEAERPLVREAIRDLRELLTTLDARPVALPAALDQWRTEFESRCRDAEVTLLWREQGMADGVELTPRAHHHVTRILREALSNALRHARPQQVRVEALQERETLELTVGNDGRMPEDASMPSGRGTAIMRQRAENLDGSVTWAREGDFWQVQLAVPLAEGSSAIASGVPVAAIAAAPEQPA